MIVALAGRKGCGKTSFSRICEEHGFKRLFFAAPLKEMVCKVLGIDKETLEATKDEKIPIKFGKDEIKILSEATSIDEKVVKMKVGNVRFSGIREIMQVVGTDLIRAHNPDWHCNRVKGQIFEMLAEDNGTNIVIDDLRFPNEKAMLHGLGAHCWYVVRPKFDNMSMHESETSLTWLDFHNIILNVGDFGETLKNWDNFLLDYNLNDERKCNIESRLADYKTRYFEYTWLKLKGYDKKYFIATDRYMKKDKFWDMGDILYAVPSEAPGSLDLTYIGGKKKVESNPLKVELLKNKVFSCLNGIYGKKNH